MAAPALLTEKLPGVLPAGVADQAMLDISDTQSREVFKLVLIFQIAKITPVALEGRIATHEANGSKTLELGLA